MQYAFTKYLCIPEIQALSKLVTPNYADQNGPMPALSSGMLKPCLNISSIIQNISDLFRNFTLGILLW